MNSKCLSRFQLTHLWCQMSNTVDLDDILSIESESQPLPPYRFGSGGGTNSCGAEAKQTLNKSHPAKAKHDKKLFALERQSEKEYKTTTAEVPKHAEKAGVSACSRGCGRSDVRTKPAGNPSIKSGSTNVRYVCREVGRSFSTDAPSNGQGET